MNNLFFDFLEARDRESYLRLRAWFIKTEAYDPYNDDLLDIDRMVETKKDEQASDALNRSMPNLLLSPRAHLLAAILADRAGDSQRADAERFVATACVEGILATGDGSRKQPYLVTRTSDEYDVLGFLSKQMAQQSLCHEEDRHLDQISTEDGQEIWFDVTDAYEKLPDARVLDQLDKLLGEDWDDEL